MQSVVKALWNALRGRHKYGAINGNQYAARRCSMITRLTRNSLTRVRVRWGAAIFAHYKSMQSTHNIPLHEETKWNDQKRYWKCPKKIRDLRIICWLAVN